MAVSMIKKETFSVSRSWGSLTDISDQSTRYVVPSDGYIKLECNYRAGSYVRLSYADGDTLIAQQSAPQSYPLIGPSATLVPVCKGMAVKIQRDTGGYSRAHFIPLNETYSQD